MKSEIQHRADFSSVRYALCWEDPDLVVAALRPAGLGHCLSIGSAGDNSFALLAAGAGAVVVVMGASLKAAGAPRRAGTELLFI